MSQFRAFGFAQNHVRLFVPVLGEFSRFAGMNLFFFMFCKVFFVVLVKILSVFHGVIFVEHVLFGFFFVEFRPTVQPVGIGASLRLFVLGFYQSRRKCSQFLVA